MARILIVDDTAVIREPIAALLANAGYQTDCAEDGPRALGKMKAQPPDLVLLDLSMPGMDGLEVLAMMRRDPRTAATPVILLTASSEKAHIIRGGELGVRDYLLKSRFNLAELLTRVRKYIAPDAKGTTGSQAAQPTAIPSQAAASPRGLSVAPPGGEQSILEAAKAAGVVLLTGEQMLRRVESAPVKTLPGGIAELIAIIGSPRGTVNDVAHSLKRDPVLASRVLRISNSAAFASARSRIATVEDAVKQIGLAGVQNLVTTVGVFEACGSAPAGSSVLRSWQHSLAVAALMNVLTPVSAAAPQGVAYIVGLCHDLSDIILRQYFSKEYEQVVELTRATGQPQRQVESIVFGLPYSDLVSMLLLRLGLPGVITAPIQEFFERQAHKQPSGAGSALGRCLRIANLYAHGLMLASTLDEPVLSISKVECHNTLGSELPVVDDAAIRAQALGAAAVMAGLSGSEINEACQQPIPKRPIRIAYARHEEYANLDPLHALLRLSAAQVDLRRDVPSTAEELDQCDCLIVAGGRSDIQGDAQDLLPRIVRLVETRPLPILFLSAADVPRMAEAPGCISIGCLPTAIEPIDRFLEVAVATRR